MLWASSPTTMRLPWTELTRSTRSPWSWLVSWYSSTSTWRKRPAWAARTAGCSARSTFQLSSRSSKSMTLRVTLRSMYRAAALEDLLGEDHELGRPVGDDVGDGGLGVHGAGDQADHHVGLGEAPREARHPQLGDARLHQLARVLAVEDAKALAVAQDGGVLPEGERRHMVEGPAPEAAQVVAEGLAPELVHPADHLPGGAVGEREEQDLLGPDPRLEEPCHPVGEGPGLPRARPGDDQERAVAGLDHPELLVVEVLGVVDAPVDGGDVRLQGVATAGHEQHSDIARTPECQCSPRRNPWRR